MVLVNDEPVTAYEVQQRANFLAVNDNTPRDIKPKAEARWAQIVKDPKTNERFQELLRRKNVKSEQEARAVQTEYVQGLQRDMLEQLRKEVRAGLMPQYRKDAQEELIEERLKVQEAKRNGIEISDDEIKRIMKSIAERNKMTEEQFAQHIKGVGIDISTMRERTRAQVAWREVIRRKFSAQVSITGRDIDRVLSSEAGEDTIELQVQKITLSMPPATGQGSLAKRYAEADGLRRQYAGCKSMASLAKEGGAKFEDLQYIKPSSVPEPTRSMLLSAKDGDILPPTTSPAGIEIFAVCGRRAFKGDEKQRERAQEELAQKEFEIAAKRHLRDLRQDAHIEFR